MQRRPVESRHGMDLRGSGQRRLKQVDISIVPARASMRVGLARYEEQDSGPVDQDHGRGQQIQPPYSDDSDGEANDNCIGGVPSDMEEDKEPSKVYRTVTSLPFIIASSLVAVLIFQVAFSEGDKEKPTAVADCGLGDLFEQYPMHKSFFKAMNTSFKLCTMSDKPGVALVLHNGNGSIADCLVNRTAARLSRLIGVSKSGKYSYVNGKDAHMVYNADSFLEEILEERKKIGVIVFNNLEEMDLDLVRQLHFICDNDQNQNDKSAIILLLKVEAHEFKEPQLSDLAHNKLGELWEKELGERFSPIIGRITNNLGYIDENIQTKCP